MMTETSVTESHCSFTHLAQTAAELIGPGLQRQRRTAWSGWCLASQQPPELDPVPWPARHAGLQAGAPAQRRHEIVTLDRTGSPHIVSTQSSYPDHCVDMMAQAHVAPKML